MTPVRFRRLALALASLALIAAATATSASAYRSATAPERKAIVAAIDRYQITQDCEATRTCSPTISNIRVSLANQSFAMADLYVRGVGGAEVLLRKLYGTWRVRDIGSSDVGCGKAPKAVRVDLEITCGGK